MARDMLLATRAGQDGSWFARSGQSPQLGHVRCDQGGKSQLMHTGCVMEKVTHQLRGVELIDVVVIGKARGVMCTHTPCTPAPQPQHSPLLGTPKPNPGAAAVDTETRSHLDQATRPLHSSGEAASSAGSGRLPARLHQRPAQKQSQPCLVSQGLQQK